MTAFDDGSQDRSAVERLVHEYARRVDAGDFDGVGRLFGHATFRAGGGAFRGAEVADVLRETVRLRDDGTPGTRHLVTNLEVTTEGDGVAHARSYYTVVQAGPDGGLRPIVSGTYEDRFERADGVWRFAERIVSTDLVGDVSLHLRPGVLAN